MRHPPAASRSSSRHGVERHQQSVALDYARWTGLWSRLGAPGNARPTFEYLAAAYAEPTRWYHSTQHIRDCLLEFDRERLLARRADEVEAALWFHDAVYVTNKGDNEERSAHLAQTVLVDRGVPHDVAQRVAALVLATRHLTLAEDPDARLVCDVDLSILGREPAEFDGFERQIRREYAWVPEPVYHSSRSAVLAGLLQRPSIYQTVPFVERYELRARQNVERALAAHRG